MTLYKIVKNSELYSDLVEKMTAGETLGAFVNYPEIARQYNLLEVGEIISWTHYSASSPTYLKSSFKTRGIIMSRTGNADADLYVMPVHHAKGLIELMRSQDPLLPLNRLNGVYQVVVRRISQARMRVMRKNGRPPDMDRMRSSGLKNRVLKGMLK